jgi:YihY family inner membrane protein
VNQIQQNLQKLDHWQRRHRLTAFAYAVVKRYGEDQAGYQAALLTYYAFLSLFPLLLVLTTLTQVIATSQPGLQQDVIKNLTTNFPVLGSQLSAHVHSLHRNGLALVTGLLFVFYGARGVADVFRHGLNHVWGVPPHEQPGFPASLFKSFITLVVGGLGFVLASVAVGFSAAAGHGPVLRLVALLANLLVLFGVFSLLFRLNLPGRVKFRETRTAAVAAACGLVVLQLAGGYLLRRELKSLDALYSYFALALGLVFWIYLQAQIIYYSAEIAVVKGGHLWPRMFTE